MTTKFLVLWSHAHNCVYTSLPALALVKHTVLILPSSVFQSSAHPYPPLSNDQPQVQVWNASTISKLQTISLTHGPALDITPFSSGDKDFLAVLSETTMSVYHWQKC